MSSPASTEWRIARRVLLALAVFASAWVLWQARSLLVPCIGAAFLAYVCVPAVDFVERNGLPRAAGVVLVALAGLVAVIGVGFAIRSAAPSAEGVLELKVRAIHAVAGHYARLMDLDGTSPSGNRLHQLAGREADGTVARAARFLALTPEEDRLLVMQSSLDARWERLRRQHFEDEELLERRGLGDPARASADSADSTDAWAGSMAASVAVLAQLLPAWVTAFFLFVFLLADDGRIKRDVFALVPNRYFEPVLSIHADLHATLQSYAKALFTQCALLGFTVAAALAIAGIPPRWALVIGFFAGMANVVPYAGIGTALAGGMLYALLGYETHPLLPFVNAENLPWAVLVAVLATDAIKNAVYDPLVFGGALELHPVAVILGVAAGATIFGFLGALFAVPALAFGRALGGSVFRQLRAYGAL